MYFLILQISQFDFEKKEIQEAPTQFKMLIFLRYIVAFAY